jgi:dephospho-CoA kinase
MSKIAPQVIGITGGIATGKSEVLRILARRGFAVLSADAVAHACLLRGTPVYRKILRRFGPTLLRKNGEIDRLALGKIVFRKAAERQWLESVVHPCVIQRLRSFARGRRRVALDIPLLFETGMQRLVNRVIVVSSTRQRQIARLAQRNGLSRSDALARIHAQWPLARKRRLADHVFHNNGTRKALRAQVISWVKKVYRG